MKRKELFHNQPAAMTIAMITLVVGCNPTSERVDQSRQPSASSVDREVTSSRSTATNPSSMQDTNTADTEHGHKDGEHGGIIISLGRDSYHIEAVTTSDGQVRLYTLGKEETRVIDIESQVLKGFIKAQGETDSREIVFEPTRQDGDRDGRTSLFVGRLPEPLIGRAFEVTIPNVRIDGERFRLGFQSGLTKHAEHPEMPTKVADRAEKEFYLTPGGRYTAADIVANGNTTATLKFQGIKSEHDMRPKTGDMLCPISGTKANPKFTWIIDGKPYQFCCPPCVDEFLSNSKSSTDPLPDPESFVKK